MLYIKKMYFIFIIIILCICSLSNTTNGMEVLNNIENSTKLKELQLDKEGIVPIFKKDVYEYYLTIPNYINEIQISATPEDQDAIIQILGNNNLKEGLNEIKIQVVVNNNVENIYTIYVTKTDNPELANTRLENLAINGIFLNPPFDTDITQYTVELPYDMQNLNILAIPEDENAQIDVVGDTNLQEGINIVNIVVTAANGITKKNYEIKAKKRNYEQELLYKKEKELKKETQEKLLQNAYKAERTSVNSNINKPKFNWHIIVIFLIVSIFSILIYKNKIDE